jgi:glutamate racemase
VSGAPLGVFDSGLGGLTVVRALRSRLPHESIVYLGDTARVPYGTRSEDTILRYARSCASVLTKRGVKALVIACNTASAVALDMLRAELDLPVVGVIDPGASAAVEIAASGPKPVHKIGVLATARTVATGAYTRAVGRLSTRLEVIGQAAPLLVPLVEEGWIEGDVPRLAAERYLEPLIHADAGVIVLGCTHYPVLRSIIEDAAARLSGRHIPVVDSAEATAAAVGALLESRGLGAPASERGSLELLVTDLPASFSQMAERCLGTGAPAATQIDL